MGTAEVDRPRPRSRAELVLKWVAGITAILSLVAGLFTVTRLLSDVQERERAISEAIATGKRQQLAGDYAAAWTTLEGAQKTADEGGQLAKLTGQLSEARRTVRLAQQDLAMIWLRQLRVPADRKFSEVVDKLLPALDRGVAGAATDAGQTEDRSLKADQLAHIGWGYYLKQRDGIGGLDPAAQYRAALDADPANPYAHAYWGHYLLSRGERTPALIAEGIGHFDAAVRSGRERGYVRAMQLAALRNLGDEQAPAQWLRVVDQMRSNAEPIGPAVVNETQALYARMVLSGRVDEQVARALPPERQIELARAMFDAARLDTARANVRDAAVAMLLEAAGQERQALDAWRALRKSLAPGNALAGRADAAIHRLAAATARRG